MAIKIESTITLSENEIVEAIKLYLHEKKIVNTENIKNVQILPSKGATVYAVAKIK